MACMYLAASLFFTFISYRRISVISQCNTVYLNKYDRFWRITTFRWYQKMVFFWVPPRQSITLLDVCHDWSGWNILIMSVKYFLCYDVLLQVFLRLLDLSISSKICSEKDEVVAEILIDERILRAACRRYNIYCGLHIYFYYPKAFLGFTFSGNMIISHFFKQLFQHKAKVK